MWAIKLLTFSLLLGIFVQDIRQRLVYWIFFPLLAISLLILSLQSQSIITGALNAGTNLVFLAFQWLMVAAYFSITRKKWVPVVGELLGWGDVLFLIAIAVYLSFVDLVIFYTGSLILILLIWLIAKTAGLTRQHEIPLAGIQSILFAGVLFADWSNSGIRLFDNYWLINYFN